MKTRFLSFFALCLLLTSSGLNSCVGSGGGGSTVGGPIADATGVAQNAANPENPPNTVSLDPNCKRGAKPEGSCKGSPLPVPARPCPSNLTAVKNAEANVWWCACPEGSQELKDADGKSKCICPSGEGLWVNADTGESLGCPRVEVPVDRNLEKNLCPAGLVSLEERRVFALPNADVGPKKVKPEVAVPEISARPEAQCGCPSGTQLWKGTGALEGQQGCQCPSGQLLPVDAATGRASKTCEELSAPCRPGLVLLMPVTPGHVNFCGCPSGTEFVYPEGGGAATACRCPSGAPVQVNPQTSEMIGSCAVNL